jgi:hypothetical protein
MIAGLQYFPPRPGPSGLCTSLSCRSLYAPAVSMPANSVTNQSMSPELRALGAASRTQRNIRQIQNIGCVLAFSVSTATIPHPSPRLSCSLHFSQSGRRKRTSSPPACASTFCASRDSLPVDTEAPINNKSCVTAHSTTRT